MSSIEKLFEKTTKIWFDFDYKLVIMNNKLLFQINQLFLIETMILWI